MLAALQRNRLPLPAIGCSELRSVLIRLTAVLKRVRDHEHVDVTHEREVVKSRKKLRRSHSYPHGKGATMFQIRSIAGNGMFSLTHRIGIATPWQKGITFMFASAMLFSLGGIFIIQTMPAVMRYLGPYYEALVKIPTWTYMLLLPTIVWTLYVDAIGVKRLGAVLLWGVVVGGASELVGTTTGVPFGEYSYTGWLGPKLLGHVPYFIPLSWFAMALVSYDLARGVAKRPWSRVMVAALFMLAWDVSLDPAMSRAFPFWTYSGGGVYYGMPLINWAGWLLVSALIMWGIERLAGGVFRRHPGASLFYAVNCVFPLGLCFLYGLYGAVAVGAVVTATVLIVSRRRPTARAHLDAWA